MQVVARGIHGKDYFEDHPDWRWSEVERIRHVANAISHIAKCEAGTEILVFKDTTILNYGHRLQDLCDAHQKVELSIVINHTNPAQC